MKYIFNFFFLLGFFIAGAQNDLFLLKFEAYLPARNGQLHQVFYMDVPAGGRIDNRSTLTGDFHKETRIIYSDSTILYITNNFESGSRANFENRYNSGFRSLAKKYPADTLNIEGVQINGRWWREHYCQYIVVGYSNVLSVNKKKYDYVLSTLRDTLKKK